MEQRQYDLTDPYEIARYIKEAKKTTPVKVYVDGNLEGLSPENIEIYGKDNFYILFGENDVVEKFLEENKDKIKKYRIEWDRRNSAIPMMDIRHVNARIEPGAIIREGVTIGDHAVIMMGAVINIGAEIGENSMIDMNAVIGARGKIGKNVHVGAGAVIAGVLEPPSKDPVIIEDDVLIGANAVILEGVKVGKGSVVAAGSVVTHDVESGVVVAGVPAKVIKRVDDKTKEKTKLLDDLRK
ncbi:2,3,4,5-tetrahydropyridine-2,6-dicarboxylate N-acetyltransferase [Caloramator sp. Dgby_cultured_2]|uniref:2,3,4,5-tetrahydropyridine-2,6-dicarboxylate N-acetyltransferase n=1 Tax=Caloramator sp. Dgby_cultured_2 TaxID=3029174 RepID=UPI00237E98C5|nr:2,3,4,5-tetrahydropyridine-2,6-dicarboxylate N-acetyltransferase [Caloramator sp. Dgby_cultured_2]WDU82169.1 2,3,4,5-tetrahydropyridine-2,6-dicarboxylate N-acetyltransferase [Caloramator sp. Dgby_cultured_2]